MTKPFDQMSKAELLDIKEHLDRVYRSISDKHLSLDLSRGKPSKEQLDLADEMLAYPSRGDEAITEDGIDTRNYGSPLGVPALRALFAELLGVTSENILFGGNSALTLLYDTIGRAMLFGIGGHTPWQKEAPVKMICPVPGYDRHFAICERFGIEMLPVPLTGHGPDMNMVEALVREDPAVKGILCVPKYSNPTGETYDEETVRRLATMKTAAPDFRIFWDMAYILHDLDKTPDTLANIFELTKGTDAENRVIGFFSTSKVTYASAGVAALVSSAENIREAAGEIFYQSISPDKLNELRHLRYMRSPEHTRAIMQRHAALLYPKFEATEKIFEEELADAGIARCTHPHGGYFLTLYVLPGTAKRTEALCREAGVKLTPAGSPFPYHRDPCDTALRIAPSYPPQSELCDAMRVVAVCAKLAAAEWYLKNKAFS